MLPLLALTTAATAEDAAAPVALAWDWTKPHRWYIENHVQLPLYMWFQTPFNHQARVNAFEVKVVVQCPAATQVSGKVWEMTCTIEDWSLSAEALPQDEHLLQPILDELDQLVTGAQPQLQVRGDGRLVNLDLEGIYRQNQRGGEVIETLRLVLGRAFAAIDLETSKKAENTWIENTPWLVYLPVSNGTSGLAQIVHQVYATQGHLVDFQSGGQGVMTMAEGESSGGLVNRYDTRLEGKATWDTRQMRLLERQWTVVGTPTSSSAIASGTAGYPYVQGGRLVALSEGQTRDVGASTVIPQGEIGQTAIQLHQLTGVRPGN